MDLSSGPMLARKGTCELKVSLGRWEFHVRNQSCFIWANQEALLPPQRVHDAK